MNKEIQSILDIQNIAVQIEISRNIEWIGLYFAHEQERPMKVTTMVSEAHCEKKLASREKVSKLNWCFLYHDTWLYSRSRRRTTVGKRTMD